MISTLKVNNERIKKLISEQAFVDLNKGIAIKLDGLKS
jgi:hypothetical protein